MTDAENTLAPDLDALVGDARYAVRQALASCEKRCDATTGHAVQWVGVPELKSAVEALLALTGGR